MKHLQKILITSMFVAALGLLVSGCVGGYVGGGGGGVGVVVDEGGYYGGGPWYHEGGWMHGPRGYAHVDVHPAGRGGGDRRR